MRKWFFFILLFPLACVAQTYHYLGVENGLSNRRVHCIQKDRTGHMWFLTHAGIDRYDGKEFKNYKLLDGTEELNSSLKLSWLYTDTNGTLWEIGKEGRVFRYDSDFDRFTLTYKLPETTSKGFSTSVTYSYIDKSNTIWLCTEAYIYLYDIQTQTIRRLQNSLRETITNIEQVDDTHFFIGSESGVRQVQLKDNLLHPLRHKKLDDLRTQVNELFFDAKSRKLFIGAFQKGIYIYDLNTKTILQPEYTLKDNSISRIKAFDKDELLIATDGAGVFKMNIHTIQITPYIVADYNSYNGMNGNSITDIYIDDDIDNEPRIWMANYPIGITVRNNRFPSYTWIKHSIGNSQSLANDQVNAIIEDRDGDLWFATNNGISWLNAQTNEWKSFFYSSDSHQNGKNHIFFTLCEVSPGVIWAGGYSSEIFQINKKTLSTDILSSQAFSGQHIRPDKLIRSILLGSQGFIWYGGYHSLKSFNPKTKEVNLYNELGSITVLAEKNPEELWIGTANGLYLLNKKSGRHKEIPLQVESTYIYSLYQAPNGLLYVGTSGYGLFCYDYTTESFTHYCTKNCALISDNIYTILSSDNDEKIILSTESGLTKFTPSNRTFQNWTKEQGLMSTHFNGTSGVLRKNNHFVFGSVDGAIEFSKDMQIPKRYSSKMVFSDFKLFYQTVYPGEANSPLQKNINETQRLELKSSQNIFSLNVSSINYDYPSNILYTWKLEGFYDEWSKPGEENIIRFTNLSPGKYKLRVKAVSQEENNLAVEERTMDIVIAYPFWLSIWALLFYLFIASLVTTILIRIAILRKQRKISDEKIDFFINTAHDIRTPLTLIKAPLEELREKESLSNNGMTNVSTALRNVNVLLHLTTNLINFERADVYSSELYVSEHELNSFMKETFDAFGPYAKIKHIQFTYETNFRYLNVWFDKEKMESILKNVISNALKYTPENGSVHLFVSDNGESWSVEVKDSGIGIPASEQKKLFKLHFRGSNAINLKIAGSGIGLMLVWKLVRLHYGKIHLNSIENQGSLMKVTFPKRYDKRKRASLSTSLTRKETVIGNTFPDVYMKPVQKESRNLPQIVIVEDNDELRSYLCQTLSEEYITRSCSNGKEALEFIKEIKPSLIISDIMMPQMRGDTLCQILKNDIETSHIPIVLLTALNNDRSILTGLQIGADEYIVKPFNIGILKATVSNLIANRILLRKKFANLEMAEEENGECFHCSNDMDWKFIASVKKSVENNMDNPAFNVDVLCSILNMSRTSFYNKIKVLTDQAPADYVRLIRLKRAAQLLKEGNHTITEIAEMTGFSDAKYFREVFKKHFNVSPSQYSKEGGHKK